MKNLPFKKIFGTRNPKIVNNTYKPKEKTKKKQSNKIICKKWNWINDVFFTQQNCNCKKMLTKTKSSKKNSEIC